MHKRLQKELQSINRGLKILLIEVIILWLFLNIFVIFQAFCILEQNKKFNKELDKECQQIEKSLSKINNKIIK